ncbi:MAG: YihY/virulence factor BrkB family protein [Burkholderiales bacterium]|nr:YihY/virulence factor BrkB family protein [Burkholderiales bacterium]
MPASLPRPRTRIAALIEAAQTSGRMPARAARLLWTALQRYLDAGGMHRGAAVAFYAAFSIAPLLVVVAGVMVWLLGSNVAQAALLDAMTRLIGASETKTLAAFLVPRPLAAAGAQPAIFGSRLALGTTLLGATGVFIELRSALQAMLGETDGAFSWWQLVRIRLLAIGVVLGCGFLLSVAMLAQALSLLALRWVALKWPALAPLLVAAESLWSWAVIALLFALMIRWLPSGRLPPRHALAGAAVAAGLFMVGRYAISLYIATTATQSALGAAGSFAALLVWVYWSSQIFLLGAAIAVELGHPPHPPSQVYGEPAR